MIQLKDFFYLQRNDRQAILVLLGIILACTTLVIVVGRLTPSDTESTHPTNAYLSKEDKNNKKDTNGEVSEQKPLYYKVDGVPHELFTFDPNTADSTQLLKLGLQAWQVRSIYKYRAKGGIFREPSDFARLYGLTKRQYEVLAPYIRIGEDYRPASDYYGQRSKYPSQNYNYTSKACHDSYQGKGDYANNHLGNQQGGNKTYSYPQKLKAGQFISINHADTTELMKIPGIGSYYAKAILRYREQLGGFASSSQLREIEDFPESALPYIRITPGDIRKLNLNKLTLNQLRKHPYLNFYQAKEICDYRRLKGPLHSLQDLKLLKDFPPAEIERLTPYVDF
mgnify:CR=1 FL=1